MVFSSFKIRLNLLLLRYYNSFAITFVNIPAFVWYENVVFKRGNFWSVTFIPKFGHVLHCLFTMEFSQRRCSILFLHDNFPIWIKEIEFFLFTVKWFDNELVLYDRLAERILKFSTIITIITPIKKTKKFFSNHQNNVFRYDWFYHKCIYNV